VTAPKETEPPYDDLWDDWDDDLGPIKEEPDCYACNDSGCSSCSHAYQCDCAMCADAHIASFEFLDDLDTGLIYAGPADEPPY
jgi:hypothetical protein